MSRTSRIAPVPGVSPPLTRRHALGTLLAAFIARFPVKDAQAGGKAGGASFMVGDTFVGRTANPEVFVAVVLGAQHVTAYVSDGAHREVDCWFSGPMLEDELDLAATNGSRLVGVRSSSGIGGWIVLRNGRGMDFLAQPATGAAGLYEVRVLANGGLYGRSSTRAVLAGEPIRTRPDWELLPSPGSSTEWQLLGLSSQQAFADGVTFAAQITLAGGYTVPVGVWMPSADPGQVWVILLANGEARGQDIAMASET